MALEDYAQQQKFPPSQAAQSVIVWIKKKDKGRCEHENSK